MSKPTLIVLVRFKSTLSLEEVSKIAEERAQEFRALPGLEQMYYLQHVSTGEFVGLYLWYSQYFFFLFRDSELRASIAEAYQVEGEPRIEIYHVMKTLRDETS